MSDNEFKFNLGVFEISAVMEKTSFGFVASVTCPICRKIETAEVHKFGKTRAFDIVKGKLKSHMIGEHDIKDKN